MKDQSVIPGRQERGTATLPLTGTEMAIGGAAIFVVAIIVVALQLLAV
jgi:hypothetical protein